MRGPALLGALLVFNACSLEPFEPTVSGMDSGRRDAGAIDAGSADAGGMDSGGMDSGPADDGGGDAGDDAGDDAGFEDAGFDGGFDAGFDAGPPLCPGLPTIASGGSITVDLCGRPDDSTYEISAGCPAGLRARRGDETFELELTAPTRLTIELTDIDPGVAIDTVLYIRSDCEDQTSQIACHDDVPCAESTVPGSPLCPGGADPRQSRITIDLPAGRHFIVVDAFDRRGDGVIYRCGLVRLTIAPG